MPHGFAVHASTARHRRAVRPKVARARKARATPSWMLAQARDPLDDVSAEDLAAAEAWALT